MIEMVAQIIRAYGILYIPYLVIAYVLHAYELRLFLRAAIENNSSLIKVHRLGWIKIFHLSIYIASRYIPLVLGGLLISNGERLFGILLILFIAFGHTLSDSINKKVNLRFHDVEEGKARPVIGSLITPRDMTMIAFAEAFYVSLIVIIVRAIS